jgi:hypothetical protein
VHAVAQELAGGDKEHARELFKLLRNNPDWRKSVSERGPQRQIRELAAQDAPVPTERNEAAAARQAQEQERLDRVYQR